MKDEILQILAHARRPLNVSEIIARGDFASQPYVSRVLAELKADYKIEDKKAGREVYYQLRDYQLGFEETLPLRGLREDEVWNKVKENQDFEALLDERMENILYFAFSEMLNNAIDHSRSATTYVKIWIEKGILKFIVSDKGIGAFRNFMAKKKLSDEVTAIQELIKGKQTTMPKWHSGEGIFWTSKLADRFILTSYNYRLTVDTLIGDYAIEHLDETVFGTEVYFEIDMKTKKSLQKLFKKYALERERYTFTTTEIPIKLYEEGEVWISRSQAKKVLMGLERYRKVILDFKGIKVIGQGFADEIFRVFRKAHPEIILEPVNMVSTVEMMVRRALGE